MPAIPAADEVDLPPDRAFLLQFTSRTQPSVDVFAGRLEHLSSGARLRFATWDSLQAAVEELLRRLGG